MRHSFLLFMCMVGFVSFAQEPTNLNLSSNSSIVGADVDISGGALFTVERPINQTSDGFIRKRDLQGVTIATGNFPNDNPSFALVEAFEVSADSNSLFAVVNTFDAVVSGFLKHSQSLINIPNNLNMDTSVNRLVAYQSGIASACADVENNAVYALYTAKDTDAALGVSPDGVGTSIIVNPGNGTNYRTWLIISDIADVEMVSHKLQIHASSTGNVTPVIDIYEGQINIRRAMYKLSSGLRAFESRVDSDLYLTIFDPQNPDSNNDGVLDPVYTFGPYGSGNKISITYCSGQYVLANYTDRYLETYDDNFNLIRRSYIFDYQMGGWPAELACLPSGDVKVFIGMGASPMAETPRAIVVDKNLVQRFASGGFGGGIPFPYIGGVSYDWVRYYKSFAINDTEVLHVANYFGPGTTIGNFNLPSTWDGHNYYNDTYGVFFRTDQTPPNASLTLNTSPAAWQEVFMNVRLDPNDPTQLIPCNEDPNCGESWVRIAPGTTLQADEVFVNDFVSGINMPSGYEVEMSNMGTDLTKPVGYQRFVMLKIKPVGIPRQSQALDNFLSMKVGLTENIQSLGLDTFNDPTFGLYPNPVSDVLNIQSQKTIEKVQVYNLTGQKVLQTKAISGSLDNVNLNHLVPGMYLVYLYANDGAQIVKKVLKN